MNSEINSGNREEYAPAARRAKQHMSAGVPGERELKSTQSKEKAKSKEKKKNLQMLVLAVELVA